ncbi:MAG: family 16 glycoside hydrolase [Phycisphaerae bacterium]
MLRNLLLLVCLALFPLAQAALAAPHADDLQFRTTLDLTDGSRLVGTQARRDLPLQLDFATLAIPLEKIRQCTLNHKDDNATIDFLNGDRLTGRLDLKTFQIDTSVGTLAPELEKIDRMTFSSWHKSDMPPGEGDAFFGGVNWLEWRTAFEIQGDKLLSLPRARPGFNYGHTGNGRGPNLFTNIGNSDWKNYRIDVDFCATGVDPAFNPYGLPPDFHDGRIMFHVTDAKESQNARGSSYYYFDIHGNGDWTLGSVYNSYCDQPVGWGNPRTDAERTLASGSGLHPDRANGNKYRIDILGKTIKVSMDGKKIVDFTDNQMDIPTGGQTLDHGGVGFGGGFDAMIWIRNFSARALPIKN